MRLSEIIEYWDGVLYTAYNIVAKAKYLMLPSKQKTIFKKNLELKDKHKGERCFIIMNGPSINEHDLSLLKDEVVFCSNHLYKSKIAQVLNPTYYCWTDKGDLVSDHAMEVVDGIRKACPRAKLILNCRGIERIGLQNDIYYTYCKHLPNIFGVRDQLDSICSNFHTVAFYTMNAALYMGFKDIYVLGLDFNPGGFVHFENLGPGTECMKPSEYTEKKNVAGLHWEYTKSHYESYDVNRFARKKKDARIINLNPHSCIRAFEFGHYESLFEEAGQ